MRVHVFQHVPFEGLGCMEPWLETAGHEISWTCFYGAGELPELEEVDVLIVLGGPMSVNDVKKYRWLTREKNFIRQAFDAGKPILGVCLGAQLIAAAMGSKVYPNEQKEIGWFPVTGIPLDAPGFFAFPPSLEVLHWHGETFDLPACAVRLAQTPACQNQAFQLGRSVIGLQFHLEMTAASVTEIVEHGRDELVEGPYIQDESAILAGVAQHADATNALMEQLLSYLTQPV